MEVKKTKITIIIPCYNSEKTIGYVVDDIFKCVSSRYKYRIILVNDHSSDCTWQVIKDLCNKNPNIIGLSLAQNFGQQAARMAALQYVEGDYVVFMDDDGQHPAEGIQKLIGKAEEGYDIVYALFEHKKESNFKKFGSWVNTRMTDWIMQKPRDVKQSSFFVVREFVVQELKKYTSPFPYLFGYFMKITKNIANVKVEHKERISGKSGYNLKKLLKLWFDGFTGFSVIPLRVISALGSLCAIIGFASGITVVVRKIMEPTVATGYTSIIAVILFCSGLILLMLGLTGEYIGRIFLTVNNLPQYVVRERVNVDLNAETNESGEII